MHNSVRLIGHDLIQIHVFHASENIHFYLGIIPCDLRYKLLNLLTLGSCFAVRIAGGAGIGETAGALNKAQCLISDSLM